MAYSRRTEFTCTEEEFAEYSNFVLHKNEVLYVVRANGLRDAYFGDGITPLNGLKPSISLSNMEQIKTDTEALASNATASATAAAKSAANAAEVLAGAEEKSNKVTHITAESTDEQYPSARAVWEAFVPSSAPKYGVLWDKVNSKCVRRLWDAADITMDTTNFGHFGAVNPNYSNPFDDIYPWSERRVCNVDLPTYYAMDKNGYDVRDCVTAWEGEDGFSYDPAPGVMVGVYTPEFWGTSYDTPEGRVFAASPVEQVGWVHFEPTIGGRWFGVQETLEIGGASKTVLGCRVGMPCTGVSMTNIHTYAENADLTLDDPYSYDATTLLMAIEYATMETQGAVGNGCSNLYTQASDTIQEAATNTNKVKVLASKAANCIVNAIIDIGTTNGGRQVANRLITAVETDPDDSTKKILTISGNPITVTTAHFWSIHGCGNTADAEIGSKSGYIGVNGKCNAYYRGQVVHGNMFRYVLGAYRKKNTNHIWIAHSRAEAELYNALNKSVHLDTGIVLPINAEKAIGGYIKKLEFVPGVLCVPPFCSEIGGTSANPVGDCCYIPKADTVDTVGIVGGYASLGADAGRLCGSWSHTASGANWTISGVPFLKSPDRGA